MRPHRHPQRPVARSPIQILLRAVTLVAIGGTPVYAQTTTYEYQGNPFTLFSCGPSSSGTGTALCSTPAPTNTNTSYTATDLVKATLSFDAPLDPNMTLQNVAGRAGFHLTLEDGHQTVATPISSGQGLIATVATDASGQITEWRLILNTGGVLNGGVATQRFVNTTTGSVVASDSGTLACCDPTVPGDLARNSGVAGVWTVSGTPPSPAALVTSLIDVVFDPLTGLTTGQINSLSDKLNNALLSILAGQHKQARNQLQSFITSVETAVRTSKMSATTGVALVGAAQAIIVLL